MAGLEKLRTGSVKEGREASAPLLHAEGVVNGRFLCIYKFNRLFIKKRFYFLTRKNYIIKIIKQISEKKI